MKVPRTKHQSCVYLFLILFSNLHGIYCKTFKIAFLAPGPSSSFPINSANSVDGVRLALRSVMKNPGILNGHNIAVKYFDTSCNAQSAVTTAMLAQNTYNPDVIVGPPCQEGLKMVAQLGTYWNLPVLSWYHTGNEFNSAKKYPTLIRMTPPLHLLSKSLVHVLSKSKIRHISMIYQDGIPWSLLEHPVRDDTLSAGIELHGVYKVTANMSSTALKQMFTHIRRISTGVVLVCPYEDVRRYMLIAANEGIANGQFTFIHLDPQIYTDTELASKVLSDGGWKRGDMEDKLARKAYKYVKHLVIDPMTERPSSKPLYPRSKFSEYSRLVGYEAGVTHVDWQLPPPSKPDAYSAYLCDGVVIWSVLVDMLVKQRKNPRDGKLVASYLKRITATGSTGHIEMNNNLDRLGEVYVLEMQQDGNFKPAEFLRFNKADEYFVTSFEPTSFTRLSPNKTKASGRGVQQTSSTQRTTTTQPTTTSTTTTTPTTTQHQPADLYMEYSVKKHTLSDTKSTVVNVHGLNKSNKQPMRIKKTQIDPHLNNFEVRLKKKRKIYSKAQKILDKIRQTEDPNVAEFLRIALDRLNTEEELIKKEDSRNRPYGNRKRGPKKQNRNRFTDVVHKITPVVKNNKPRTTTVVYQDVTHSPQNKIKQSPKQAKTAAPTSKPAPSTTTTTTTVPTPVLLIEETTTTIQPPTTRRMGLKKKLKQTAKRAKNVVQPPKPAPATTTTTTLPTPVLFIEETTTTTIQPPTTRRPRQTKRGRKAKRGKIMVKTNQKKSHRKRTTTLPPPTTTTTDIPTTTTYFFEETTTDAMREFKRRQQRKRWRQNRARKFRKAKRRLRQKWFNQELTTVKMTTTDPPEIESDVLAAKGMLTSIVNEVASKLMGQVQGEIRTLKDSIKSIDSSNNNTTSAPTSAKTTPKKSTSPKKKNTVKINKKNLDRKLIDEISANVLSKLSGVTWLEQTPSTNILGIDLQSAIAVGTKRTPIDTANAHGPVVVTTQSTTTTARIPPPTPPPTQTTVPPTPPPTPPTLPPTPPTTPLPPTTTTPKPKPPKFVGNWMSGLPPSLSVQLFSVNTVSKKPVKKEIKSPVNIFSPMKLVPPKLPTPTNNPVNVIEPASNNSPLTSHQKVFNKPVHVPNNIITAPNSVKSHQVLPKKSTTNNSNVNYQTLNKPDRPNDFNVDKIISRLTKSILGEVNKKIDSLKDVIKPVQPTTTTAKPIISLRKKFQEIKIKTGVPSTNDRQLKVSSKADLVNQISEAVIMQLSGHVSSKLDKSTMPPPTTVQTQEHEPEPNKGSKEHKGSGETGKATGNKSLVDKISNKVFGKMNAKIDALSKSVNTLQQTLGKQELEELPPEFFAARRNPMMGGQGAMKGGFGKMQESNMPEMPNMFGMPNFGLPMMQPDVTFGNPTQNNVQSNQQAAESTPSPNTSPKAMTVQFDLNQMKKMSWMPTANPWMGMGLPGQQNMWNPSSNNKTPWWE